MLEGAGPARGAARRGPQVAAHVVAMGPLMPRPRSPSDKVAAALALMDEGHSAEEAAAKVGGVSMRTLYRRRGETAAVPAPVPPGAARAPLPPATARDAEIDKMLTGSRTWLRVTEAIARALAAYPEAAAAVAQELRGIAL